MGELSQIFYAYASLLRGKHYYTHDIPTNVSVKYFTNVRYAIELLSSLLCYVDTTILRRDYHVPANRSQGLSQLHRLILDKNSAFFWTI